MTSNALEFTPLGSCCAAVGSRENAGKGLIFVRGILRVLSVSHYYMLLKVTSLYLNYRFRRLIAVVVRVVLFCTHVLFYMQVLLNTQVPFYIQVLFWDHG